MGVKTERQKWRKGEDSNLRNETTGKYVSKWFDLLGFRIVEA